MLKIVPHSSFARSAPLKWLSNIFIWLYMFETLLTNTLIFAAQGVSSEGGLYTAESIVTLSGSVGVTTLVGSVYQSFSGRNPRWLALLVAMFCSYIGFSLQSKTENQANLIQYFLIFVNGCLIYASATGITQIGGNITGASSQRKTNGNDGTIATLDDGQTRRRRFFSPWW